jgi:hypothetical protein
MMKRNNTSFLKNVICLIIGIPIILLFLPVLPFIILKDKISLIRFRNKNDGNIYLICTRRRGWYDFLNNNVISVLPGNFRTAWHHRARDSKRDPIFENIARAKIFGIEKPYLVIVKNNSFQVISLNKTFQEIKKVQEKSKETQSKALEIIRNNIKSISNQTASCNPAPQDT